jgi:hypothetical protein
MADKAKKAAKSKRVEKKSVAKAASKSAAPSEKATSKRPVKKAAEKKQAKPAAPAAKAPAKKASKAAAPAKKRYNAGPERGDNSFPPSNKGNKGFNSHGATGPAADSSSGPGGVTKQGRGRGENVGGNVKKSKD